MTPRQLKYFIEIARQLSFTKASAILHITQPALSRQIQELETTLGVKLFTRSDLGVSLTAAGQLLKERAPTLIEAYRQVSLDVAALADTPTGSLRFGVPPSLCDLVTIPSAREYKEAYPGVRLSIIEASSTELTEHISSGSLDFAIVALSGPTPVFSCTPLLREQMYLVSCPGSLTAPQRVDSTFLKPLPLLASRQPNVLRRILDDTMLEVGGKSRIVLEANSVRILTKAAAEGLGHCVLPYSAIAEPVSQGHLEARAIDRLFVTWALLHVRNVEPTPSVVALINTIIAVAQRASSDHRWEGLEFLADALPDTRR